MIPTGDLDLALMALVGGLLVLAGLAMLYVSRRRSRARGNDEA